MKKCSDDCEALCDFCVNFNEKDWLCTVNDEERLPHDSCEKDFECFRYKPSTN